MIQFHNFRLQATLQVLTLFSFIFLGNFLANAQQQNDNRVMLQGFYWEAAADNPDNWYNIINGLSQEISDMGIDMIWLPPPSDAGSLEGYLPKELNNFSNNYGNATDHQNMLSALNAKGIDPVADIVINHRVGSTNYVDFTNPQWGTDAITAGDEVWGVPAYYNTYPRGANDTGTGYEAARDIDHTKPYVQTSIIQFLNNLKAIGYKGWRYDFVHGFDPYYFKLYNNATNPTYSVGEYYNSDKQTIQNWIDASESAAFDFPTYFTLKSVIRDNNYSYLSNNGEPSGGIGWDGRNNTTFIENHDTPRYDTPNNVLNGTNVGQTYAYLLTHPGVPCIYWPHLFDWGTNVKTEISDLVGIRKAAGIHSESAISIEAAQNDLYAAIINGDNYQIAMKMGSGNWSPSGNDWVIEASGNNYAVWKKDTPPPTEYFTIYTQNFTNIYSWDDNMNATNGAWPGASMIDDGNGWFSASVPGPCANLIFSNNGSGQTADLSTCDDLPYYYNDSWNANPPSTTTTSFTVFVQNYTNIYSWDDNLNATNGDWPGATLTTIGNWKTITVSGPCSNLIFNDNGSNQTADLYTCEAAPYYYQGVWYANDPLANNNSSFTVYAQGYSHVYSWDDNLNATNGTWPGIALSNAGNGYMSATVSGNCSDLIFSNNGADQTGDLYACNDKPYYYNNDWYAGASLRFANTNPKSDVFDNDVFIWPNPFKDRAKVSIQIVNKQNKVLVELVDVHGNVSKVFFGNVTTGKQDITIDTNQLRLQNGFYFCRITIDGKTTNKKLIKF